MITNINKKVICVKDIPSNIIEEAIFILKTDSSNMNTKNSEKRKELAQKEAEDFLNEYILKFRNDSNNKVKKKEQSKVKTIAITVLALIICSLIFIFK